MRSIPVIMGVVAVVVSWFLLGLDICLSVENITYVDARAYMLMGLVLVIVVTAVLYLLYRTYLYRIPVIMSHNDVWRLRSTWLGLFGFSFPVHLFLNLLAGTLIIREKNAGAWASIFIVGVLQGLVGMVSFWAASFILPLPSKVKYVPFMRGKWR